ncbi:MAG: GH36 C-terminal domain-containing protein, partial [Bacteroidota bacterium]
SPYEHPYAAFQFVQPDQRRSVLFGYLVEPRWRLNYSHEPLRFQGLDPQKTYRIRELNLFPGTTSPVDFDQVYSGQFLMEVGFNPDVSASRSSVVLEILATE